MGAQVDVLEIMTGIVEVEVWMDPLCPWCLILHRRLHGAVAGTAGPSRLRLVWRSYELGPDLPREPSTTAAEGMRAPDWWGEAAEERIALIREHGRREGVELNLEVARPVNSFDAHRLIHLAFDRGVGDAVLAAVMAAYHTDGANIADPGALRRIGSDSGLDAADLDDLFGSDRYAAAVRADEARARELGVRGVPTLVIAGGEPIASSGSSTDELVAVFDAALRQDAAAAPGSKAGQ